MMRWDGLYIYIYIRYVALFDSMIFAAMGFFSRNIFHIDIDDERGGGRNIMNSGVSDE